MDVGMLFLLSIVLRCPWCGLRAGRHQEAWQALGGAGERFRRERTRCEWLKLFNSSGIGDQPAWGSPGQEALGAPRCCSSYQAKGPGTLADLHSPRGPGPAA